MLKLYSFITAKCNAYFIQAHVSSLPSERGGWGGGLECEYQILYFHFVIRYIFPRGDAGGLSREYVLRIPSVS